MKKFFLSRLMVFLVVANLFSATNIYAQNWKLTGNFLTPADTGLLGTTNNKAVSIITNGANRLFINRTGAVGINTNNPLSKFHVSGAQTMEGQFSFTNGNYGIQFGNPSPGYVPMMTMFKSGTANSDRMVLAHSPTYANWGLQYLDTADKFNFISDGIPVLTADLGARRVGIGTSSPTTALDIVGQVRIQGGTPGVGKVLTSDAAGLASWTTPGATPWSVSGSNIFNSNSGNVGIGSSTPGAKLDVKSASSYVAQFNGTSNMYIGLFENDIYRGYLGSYAGDVADVDFGTGSGNNGGSLNLTIQASPKMTIDSVGRVGVGTTLPAARLDVLNTIGTTGLNVVNNYAASSSARGIQVSSKGNMGYGYGIQATGGLLGGYFIGDGDSATGTVYGAFCTATGGGTSSGDRIGVYGSASGAVGTGNDAWGGYFPTKVYATEMRIGTTTGATDYKLSVNGKIIGTEVRVEALANWPDYVFDKNYKLTSLDDLEAKLNADKHLPGVPSATEVKENGIMLGEMQSKTIEKVEENTLYILQLHNMIKELKKEIELLKKANK